MTGQTATVLNDLADRRAWHLRRLMVLNSLTPTSLARLCRWLPRPGAASVTTMLRGAHPRDKKLMALADALRVDPGVFYRRTWTALTTESIARYYIGKRFDARSVGERPPAVAPHEWVRVKQWVGSGVVDDIGAADAEYPWLLAEPYPDDPLRYGECGLSTGPFWEVREVFELPKVSVGGDRRSNAYHQGDRYETTAGGDHG